MIPGEYLLKDDDIIANSKRPVTTLEVRNTGDRPVQIGSHYHFYEVNLALDFDREKARGLRLNIPAGTATRFEPGEHKQVSLIPFAGNRAVWGHRARVNGAL